MAQVQAAPLILLNKEKILCACPPFVSREAPCSESGPPFLDVPALLPQQPWHLISPGAHSLPAKRSSGQLHEPSASRSSSRLSLLPLPTRAPGISLFLSVLYLSPAPPAEYGEGLIRACQKSAFGSQGEKCCLSTSYDGKEMESR